MTLKKFVANETIERKYGLNCKLLVITITPPPTYPNQDFLRKPELLLEAVLAASSCFE